MSRIRRRSAATRSFWIALMCPLAGTLLVLLYPTAEWAFDVVLLLWLAAACAVTVGTWFTLRSLGLILQTLGAGTIGCLAVILAPLLALVAYLLVGGDATLDIPVMSSVAP